MTHLPPSERTTVKRLAKRGVYDPAAIHAILDEGLVCHVAFLVDGQPCIVPTLYVRVDDYLYLHGSPASRMLRTLTQGATVCVEVTLVDGLVLARSAFHHSMNYRSVVLYGSPFEVEDTAQKNRILYALSEHIIRGRWREVREPSEDELRKTLVVGMPIAEASAKVRVGPPLDDEEDYALPTWAGVLPLRLVPGEPVADARLDPKLKPPAHVVNYTGPGPAVTTTANGADGPAPP